MLVPVDKSGRNITMDNFYTFIPLANDLFCNHRTTIVGTMKKNKRELPIEFKDVKGRPVASTMFGFGAQPNNTLLVSYVPKKNKNVIILSTFHKGDDIDPDTGNDFKPEVITFYNLTKGGVDVVDRKKKEYSVKRISNRWSLSVFLGLLNLATVNSQIVYALNTQDKMERRVFITQLAKAISKPLLLKRSTIPTLSLQVKSYIRSVLGQDALPQTAPPGNDILNVL